MKILMILAALIAVAGVALSDSVLAVLGVVSLAMIGIDALARRQSFR